MKSVLDNMSYIPLNDVRLHIRIRQDRTELTHLDFVQILNINFYIPSSVPYISGLEHTVMGTSKLKLRI